jgi:hypothetical protein
MEEKIEQNPSTTAPVVVWIFTLTFPATPPLSEAFAVWPQHDVAAHALMRYYEGSADQKAAITQHLSNLLLNTDEREMQSDLLVLHKKGVLPSLTTSITCETIQGRKAVFLQIRRAEIIDGHRLLAHGDLA